MCDKMITMMITLTSVIAKSINNRVATVDESVYDVSLLSMRLMCAAVYVWFVQRYSTGPAHSHKSSTRSLV